MSSTSHQNDDFSSSEDPGQRWDTNIRPLDQNAPPPGLPAFPSLDIPSSFLWPSDLGSASDWLASGLDPTVWSLPDTNLGPQANAMPHFAASAMPRYTPFPSYLPSTHLDPLLRDAAGSATFAPAFNSESLFMSQTAPISLGEEGHFPSHSLAPFTVSESPVVSPSQSIPGRAGPAIMRDWQQNPTHLHHHEDQRLRALRTPHLPPQENTACLPDHRSDSPGDLQVSGSSSARSTTHTLNGSNRPGSEFDSTAAQSRDDDAVSLTWEMYDWLFSVMYPKRRSNKRIPTPSGRCLLCSSISKKPGILQQHLTILHRQRVARKFILGQYTSFDLVIAFAFVVAQLRLNEMEHPTRIECDVFLNMLRASPTGLQSVSLAEFPILGQHLAEFADHESWKGLQCSRCGVKTTRKVALMEHALVCTGKDPKTSSLSSSA